MKRKLICGILVFIMMLSIVGCSVKPLTTYGPTQSPGYPTYTPTEGHNNSLSNNPVYIDLYSMGMQQFNTEEYTDVEENSYSKTLITPLSTFAADVDTASYSLFRQMVNLGRNLGSIPSGAIRTEEMVNYFRYNYAKPEGDDPFGVTTVVSECPWNADVKLMSVGITTNDMGAFDIPSSNIVFLIDVSGSMSSSNKLSLIKQAMALAVENFGEDDCISIVTYASGTTLVMDGETGNNHKKITDRFNNLNAGGGTYGSGGIELAYETAEKHFIEGGVNRVILCTDGDFNIGQTSQSELEELIKEKAKSGIFLSVLGFGMGNYSDTTMETLADNGNGNYAYIDNLKEARKVLVDEMTSTFVTVAKDVKFQVEFNPAVVAGYRLVGYENRTLAAEDFTDDTKDGGEIGAGHQVTALYEIILADSLSEESKLKYQTAVLSEKGACGDEYCTLSIAYKAPDGDTSNYLEYPIRVGNYTENPSDDFRFAACVAETSLIIRNSPYLKLGTQQQALKAVLGELKKFSNLSEFQQEFVELVGQLE